MDASELRDIDVRVHREVMGRQAHASLSGALFNLIRRDADGTVWMGSLVPAYSEDIAAAWQVFDAMTRRLTRRKGRCYIGHVGGNADVGFATQFTGECLTDYYEAKATTMPLAICRAALAACEQKAGAA